jgi:glyceraldehyde 3-phosphate dehydrogenase
MIKIAINGFGRIGRAAFKVAQASPEVEVVAINDLGEIENLAYLLKYDSVYGRYGQEIETKGKDLIVGGRVVRVLQEPEPAKLPWRELGVEVVIESTGIFTRREQVAQHLAAGAKKVVISAPTDDGEVSTVVMGVNDKDWGQGEVTSNASCTTNCVSTMIAVLVNSFGVEKALLSTVHAYTATQALVDGPAKKDPRRGRAAAVNLVPSSTGAAEAVTATLPELTGKFDGVSLRVPVPVVSLSDVTAVLTKEVTGEEVNDAFRAAAANPLYKQVLAVTEEPVVSSDFIGDPHSATVDLSMTRVVGGNLVKVMAWYDNEWGYANRLIEHVVATANAE